MQFLALLLLFASTHASTNTNSLRSRRLDHDVPSNNECESATKIEMDETIGTNIGATISHNILGLEGVDSVGPTVWYSFIGTGATLEFTLDCGDAPFDAAVKVLSGDDECKDYLGDYFGSGDMCQEGVSVLVDSQPKVKYYLLVEGADINPPLSSMGDFTLIMRDASDDTAMPSVAPTFSPTPAPVTPTPQRVRLAAGDTNNYMTVSGQQGFCNRFIVSNPRIETRARRDGDNANSQIFILHPNGELESEPCRDLFVALDRVRPRSCCTPEAHAGETIDSTCDRGDVFLRQSNGFYLTNWVLQQTRPNSSDHYAFFARDCDFSDNRAMQHSLNVEGEVDLGSFGPEDQSSFGPRESGRVFEWRIEPIQD